jgi:hypothetical protein
MKQIQHKMLSLIWKVQIYNLQKSKLTMKNSGRHGSYEKNTQLTKISLTQLSIGQTENVLQAR